MEKDALIAAIPAMSDEDLKAVLIAAIAESGERSRGPAQREWEERMKQEQLRMLAMGRRRDTSSEQAA